MLLKIVSFRGYDMAKGLDAEARKLAKAKQSKKERDKRHRSKPEFKIKKAGQNARRRITEAEAKVNPNTGKPYKINVKSFRRSVQNLREGLAGQPEAMKARQGRVAKAQKQIEKTGRAVIPRSPRGGSKIIPTRGHYVDPIEVGGKDRESNMTAQDKSSNSSQGKNTYREVKYEQGRPPLPGTVAEFPKEKIVDFKQKELARLKAARLSGTLGGVKPLTGMAGVLLDPAIMDPIRSKVGKTLIGENYKESNYGLGIDLIKKYAPYAKLNLLGF